MEVGGGREKLDDRQFVSPMLFLSCQIFQLRQGEGGMKQDAQERRQEKRTSEKGRRS